VGCFEGKFKNTPLPGAGCCASNGFAAFVCDLCSQELYRKARQGPAIDHGPRHTVRVILNFGFGMLGLRGGFPVDVVRDFCWQETIQIASATTLTEIPHLRSESPETESA